eukprot:m51a1_g8662 hypothetical protein (331) ;mRNA; f:83418-84650
MWLRSASSVSSLTCDDERSTEDSNALSVGTTAALQQQQPLLQRTNNINCCAAGSHSHDHTPPTHIERTAAATCAFYGALASIPKPPPVLGPSMGKGIFWEDYSMKGRRGVVARVYSDPAGKPLSREIEALTSLGAVRWAPRLVDRTWSFSRGLVVLERPEAAVPLPVARAALSTRETLCLWLSIGDALARLGELGWMHTALCPRNVLVVGASRVMLCDWCFSTQSVGHHSARDVRQGGRNPSGPWAPPEQAHGMISRGCDVYSWVALLYWILTGHDTSAPRAPCAGVRGAAQVERDVFERVLCPDPARRCTDLHAITAAAQSWLSEFYTD